MIAIDKIAYNEYTRTVAYSMSKYIRTYDDAFTLESVLCDWSTTRRSHIGGWYKNGPGINLAMTYLTKTTGVYKFHEYPSFAKRADIGSFYYNNYKHKVVATIAHEVAHAWQFYDMKHNKIKTKPHGIEFKRYYKILREQFVNPYLADQAVLSYLYYKDVVTSS